MDKRLEQKRRKARDIQGQYNIHMKSGREAILTEIGNAYWKLYPARARWFVKQLGLLRQVTTHKYVDVKNREAKVEYRIPQELGLFIRRWIPDFLEDDADIQLMLKVWPDLTVPFKDRRKHTTFWKGSIHNGTQRRPGKRTTLYRRDSSDNPTDS